MKRAHQKMKEVVPSSRVPEEQNFPRDDIVQDMQEQIRKLITLLRDERRSHQHSFQMLSEETQRRSSKVSQQHEEELRQLLQAHRLEIRAIETQHKKILEEEKICAEERYAVLEKDYDFLKSSFHTYKESISEEMQEKWFQKENQWKLKHEKEQQKQLKKEQGLQEQFQKEMDQMRKSFEIQIAALDRSHQALKSQLSDKEATISMLTTTLKSSQAELDLTKEKLAALVRLFSQRVLTMDEKQGDHRLALITEIVGNKLQHKIESPHHEAAEEPPDADMDAASG
ncbi:flagellum-associated coiled-coil domain-containing protein 1-like isoform X2 [Lepisosteus oculatus]|uniref:flagellum-associated coiled-coil domain-containing protein 1-like isoform X2 n=1 Tax=Lepisosteus oculatus TaxID=7918 RepID=UPI0035F52078